MLSKNQLKHLRALHRKKERRELGQFLVEGEKMVVELLASNWPVISLFATPAFLQQQATLLQQQPGLQPVVCSPETLAQAGTLASNNAALAVARSCESASGQWQPGEWLLALDRINDPGNLGSLLRIADWYGIRQVVCSPDTAELYNPKTLAASKGSFLRVDTRYQPLPDFFDALPPNTEILGAYLGGESIHDLPLQGRGGVLLLGSEAQGIHPALASRVTRRITIPAFGSAESLNVGMAAAIICDNLRRLES